MLSIDVGFTKISYAEHQHLQSYISERVEIQVIKTRFPHEKDNETYWKFQSHHTFFHYLAISTSFWLRLPV